VTKIFAHPTASGKQGATSSDRPESLAAVFWTSIANESVKDLFFERSSRSSILLSNEINAMDPNTSSAGLLQLTPQRQDKGLLTRYNVFMAISIIVTALYLIHKGISRARSFRAPLVGRRFSWEPKWLIGLRFSQSGLEHLMEGCKRVTARVVWKADIELHSGTDQY
jgi:hypothetical protein